jgi:hypothetical protein
VLHLQLGPYFSGHHGLPSQTPPCTRRAAFGFYPASSSIFMPTPLSISVLWSYILTKPRSRLVARVQSESWSPRGTWIGLRCLPRITSRAVSSSLPVYSQRTRSPPSRSKQSAARKKQGNPGCLLMCSMPKIKPLKVVETLPTSVVIQSVFPKANATSLFRKRVA